MSPVCLQSVCRARLHSSPSLRGYVFVSVALLRYGSQARVVHCTKNVGSQLSGEFRPDAFGASDFEVKFRLRSVSHPIE